MNVNKIPPMENIIDYPTTCQCGVTGELRDLYIHIHSPEYSRVVTSVCRHEFERGDNNHNPYLIGDSKQMLSPEDYPEGYDYWLGLVRAILIKKLGYYTVNDRKLFKVPNWTAEYMEGQRPIVAANRIIKKCYKGAAR